MVTRRPRDSRMAARDAAAIPLPREDTTPPVTNTYLVVIIKTRLTASQAIAGNLDYNGKRPSLGTSQEAARAAHASCARRLDSGAGPAQMAWVLCSSQLRAAPCTRGSRRSRTCAWYSLSQRRSAWLNNDASIQRVSIGHKVRVSKRRNCPYSVRMAGTAATRFSMRMPHRPGRYRPGSLEVIMPARMAECG